MRTKLPKIRAIHNSQFQQKKKKEKTPLRMRHVICKKNTNTQQERLYLVAIGFDFCLVAFVVFPALASVKNYSYLV